MGMNYSFRFFIRIFLAALLFLHAPFIAFAEPIQIEIWDFPRWLMPGETTNRFAWLESKIKEFEALYPNVTINPTRLTWQRGHEKLMIAALGNSYPDIGAGTIPLRFIQEGLIEPIDSFLSQEDRNDYFDSALNSFMVDGKIYGWPWYMSGQLLYVNKDIFQRANVRIPHDGRWTLKEFQDKMLRLQKFYANNDEKEVHYQLSYPLGLYFQRAETANFPFIKAMGGSFISDDGSFKGNSREIHQGIEWVKDFQKKKIAPPDSGGRSANDIWTGFARQNRFAVAAFGLWGIRGLRNLNPPMNFRVVHFPAMKSERSGSFIGTSGFYVFRRDDKRRVKMAMKFASFLTNSENQKYLAYYNQFPTRASTGNIYEGDKQMSRALEIFEQGRTVFADSRWPQIDEQLQTSIQQILLGRVDMSGELERLEERVNNILDAETGSITKDFQRHSFVGYLIILVGLSGLVFAVISKQIHVAMIIPALTVIGLFMFYPLCEALILAFRVYRPGEAVAYSLENFILVLKDEQFYQACINTLKYTVFVVPANIFTALVVASLASNLTKRSKSFFRAAYYLPGVASVVVLTMIWRWIFNMEVGLFNSLLGFFGFEQIGWLTDPDFAMWSVILTGILKSPGGAMLIYMASIDNIPDSLYESAELEGASEIQKWWHITVPLLRSTTTFLAITGTIASLQVFAQVMMLTDGGPGFSTSVVVHRIYTSAFRDFDFGLSAAMALILFVVIMIITLIQRKYISKDMEYLG